MFTADIQEYQDNHTNWHTTTSLHRSNWLQHKLAVDFLNRLGFVYAIDPDLQGVEHRFAPGTYSPVTVNSAQASLNINIDNPPYNTSDTAMFSVYLEYSYDSSSKRDVIVTCFDALSNTVSASLLLATNPSLSIVLHAEEAENFSSVISHMIEAFIVIINRECLRLERNPHTALEYALEDAWVQCNQKNHSTKAVLSDKEFANLWIKTCVKKLLSVKEQNSYNNEFQHACHDVLTECYCPDSVDFSGFPIRCGDSSKLAENLLPFLCQAVPFAPFGA